jgi:hypothetical protein
MGMLSGIIGNVSEVDPEKLEKEFKDIVFQGEEITQSFKLIRDLVVFTTKRLILVDKQGLTGKKVEYRTIPYKSITQFSVETSGHFDLDSELKIWLSGMNDPIKKQFKKGSNIRAIQNVLAQHILG